MSRIISSFVALVLLLSAAPLSFAQEQVEETEILSTVTTGGANSDSPLNCFDFYKFNSVKIQLESAVENTVPGTLMSFFGTIENTNSYPLTNATLVAKVFRVNEELVQQSNGNELVDYFVLEQNMGLEGNETKNLNIDWKVPANAAGGNYFVTVYVTDNNFAISGLAFSDDVYSNAIYFEVTGEEGKSVHLNKNATTLNGEAYRFVDFPPTVSASATPVIVATELVNFSGTVRTVPLQWKQYSFDASKDSNLRKVKTEVVSLEPGETKIVSYEIKADRAPVVFVTATTEDRGVKSILHIRYVQEEKADITRLSFAGLSSFPLTQGSEITALACAHSTGEELSDNKLTITLTDNYTGEVIHTYKYEGNVAGQVGGYGEMFVPALGYDNVTLSAVLEHQGVIVESAEVVYDCNQMSGIDCAERTTPTSLFNKLLDNSLWFFGGVGILLLLLFLVWSAHKRHNTGPKINVMNTTPPISSLFFLLLLPAFLLFIPAGVIEAKTATVSGTASGNGGSANSIHLDFEAEYTILYHATLINQSTGAVITDGATLTAGTIIELRPATRERSGVRTSDIHYNFTGTIMGTPNGAWNSGYYPADKLDIAYGTGCGGMLDRNYNVFTTFTVPVVPELMSLSGVAYTELSPGVYRLDSSSNSAVASVQFPSTTGAWNSYNRSTSAPYCGNGYRTINKVIGPATLNFNFNVTGGANRPPTIPNITGPTSARTTDNNQFVFNSTDPDVDTLRYGIDWNMDGIVNQWVPTPPSYVPSGTDQSANRTWSEGSYTFQVLAVDNKGATFGWRSHSVTVTLPPPPDSCPTGTVTNIESSGEDYYPNDCQSTSQGGNVGLPVCSRNYTMVGEPVVSDTDVNNGQCMIGPTQLFAGRCSYETVDIAGSCAAAPTNNLTINGSDGPLSVNKGSTLNIVWTSTDATSCTLYGAGLPGGSVALNGNTSVSANAITSSPETYVLSCDTASDSVNVTVQNQPPVAPTIAQVGGNRESGETQSFTFRGTDPDNDQIFYEIDWMDGSSIISTPGSSYVASGTTLPGTRSWPTIGSKTFRARTVDFDNARSGWTTHTITIVAGPPPTVNFEAINTTTGERNTTALTIGAQDNVTLEWTSSASSCTATAGSGFSTGNSANSSDSTINEPAADSSAPFTINCGGVERTITITSEAADLSVAAASITVDEASFNGATMTYANGTVSFIPSNVTSRSAIPGTTATLAYNGGRTAATPGIAGGTEYAGQITIPVTNVPVGSFSAVLTLNQPQSVGEKTRANNTATVTNNVGAPDPGLKLRPERTQVRQGETTNLEWSVQTLFTMSCTIAGPGINPPYSFSPSTLTGTITSGIINAKSTYTFSCTAAGSTWTTSADVETVGTLEEV